MLSAIHLVIMINNNNIKISQNKTTCHTDIALLENCVVFLDWQAVRTTRRTFSAQFDLMKDIRVRVYTLLSGPCTNGIMIKSTNYTELVQKPPSMGVVNTAVQDFVCVYHNMKYMVCNWGKHAKMPANSQLNLYFWHRELEHAKECSKYIISSGIRSGCNFTGMSLPDFTDINLCLNGSSPKGPLKPKYISLQIQNHGTSIFTYTLLKLTWDLPVGRIPRHCLEWQVEHNKEGPGGKIALVITINMLALIVTAGVLLQKFNCAEGDQHSSTFVLEMSWLVKYRFYG
uniref:Type I cytokine receptor cytokine-binding domain-containing protein n=1 Tax=Mola mola TaxID=94237 RepID=A0A3Q3VPJ8_MOLML